MARTEATMRIDGELLAAVRKRARRLGRPEGELVEEALRRYLGLDGLLGEIWAASPDDLSEEQALALAYSELRASRDEQR